MNETYGFAEVLGVDVDVADDAARGVGRAVVPALDPLKLGAPVPHAGQVVLARVEPRVAFRRAQRHIPEPLLPRVPFRVLIKVSTTPDERERGGERERERERVRQREKAR